MATPPVYPAILLILVSALSSCGTQGSEMRPAGLMDEACVLEFTDTNEVHGTITRTTEQAYAGARSSKATYDGSTLNGYARALWHIDWRPGDEIWWGTAAYLPTGTTADVADYFALMRWDNFGTYGAADDKGGVVFNQGRGWTLTGGPMNLPIPPLPEGRWFTLDVHEILAQDSSGLSEVYVDGQKVASITGRNMARSPIDRLRVGIVGITAGEQNEPLSGYFDRAWISQTSGFDSSLCRRPR